MKKYEIDGEIQKISPIPSFPKRGTRSQKRGIPKYLQSKIILFRLDHSPFEKGGQKGDLNFFTASGGKGGLFGKRAIHARDNDFDVALTET